MISHVSQLIAVLESIEIKSLDMNQDLLIEALTLLADMIEENASIQKILLIIGGSGPLILQGILKDRMTQDIDSITIQYADLLRPYIQKVASILKIRADWLDFNFATFKKNIKSYSDAELNIVFKKGKLTLASLSNFQLLAMKLDTIVSHSDRPKDMEDSLKLITFLKKNYPDPWEELEPYLKPSKIEIIRTLYDKLQAHL